MRLRLLTRPCTGRIALYLGAAVLYIVIGVFVTDFLLSVFVAAGYLMLATWLIPAGLRRLR